MTDEEARQLYWFYQKTNSQYAYLMAIQMRTDFGRALSRRAQELVEKDHPHDLWAKNPWAAGFEELVIWRESIGEMYRREEELLGAGLSRADAHAQARAEHRIPDHVRSANEPLPTWEEIYGPGGP